jgi:hypothetical protein
MHSVVFYIIEGAAAYKGRAVAYHRATAFIFGVHVYSYA